MGHEAFLKNEGSVVPEDEHDTNFHFSFSDLFQDFDDGLFEEESHFHWSFLQDFENQENPFKHYSFEGHGYHFHFGDVNMTF